MSDSAIGAQGTQQVNLAQVSVPRLLFALLRQRFTGRLLVQQPPPHMGNRGVWFRGGMPLFTDWSSPPDVLGQVLVHSRTIDEEQQLRALEAMAADGGLLGAHLVSQGALDRARLLEGLRRQCERKLVKLFALRAGQAHVVIGDAPEIEADLLPVNALRLIRAGVSSIFDHQRIHDELGPIVRATVQAAPSLTKYRAHFMFPAADEPMLDALVKGTTVAQLGALSNAPDRAVQLVYTLWACQMLRADTSNVAPVAEQSAASAAAPPAPAVPVAPAAPVAAPAPAAPAAPVASAPPSPSPAVPKPAAAAVTASADDDDDDRFIVELRTLESRIEQGDHAFDLFGLELSATKRDLRRVWGDLSRKFHPDALSASGRTHLRDRVSSVFAALSEAHQILGDAEQRQQLRESIEKGEHTTTTDGRDATAQARAVFQSELLAKEADKLLRANKFDRALERYREAATYNAEEPDIKAATAWCEYQVSGKDTPDKTAARDKLFAVIEESPRIPRAHYFLGFVLNDLGNPAAAIDAFGKAVELDPRLIDAERQARALKMKMGRSPDKGGKPKSKDSKGAFSGLRGLFGKK
ncbi:MAG: DUF4388 domain-containing protein [Myxococcota bacterium]